LPNKYFGVSFKEVNIEEVYSKLFIPYANYDNFKTKDTSFITAISDMYNVFIAENPKYTRIIAGAATAINRAPLDKAALEKKWIKWYAEIRNIEKGRPIGSVKLRKIITKAHHIYLTGLPDNEQMITMAIQYIEYALGPIAIKAAAINKSLTIKEDSTILIPALLEF
jgi:hypothetical protein